MGPGNHVLDWGPHPLWEGGTLRKKGRPIVKYRDTLRPPASRSVQLFSHAKTTEPIVMPLDYGLGLTQGIMN